MLLTDKDLSLFNIPYLILIYHIALLSPVCLIAIALAVVFFQLRESLFFMIACLERVHMPMIIIKFMCWIYDNNYHPLIATHATYNT